MEPPALRYLSGSDVEACLPPLDVQLELAARALTALHRGEAEMPPKVGVHPRPGALLHAMPAWHRPTDLVGMKWVSAFPGNTGHRLPAITGLIVLNDPDTGLATCVMDGTRITAVRTAAVSGVAVRLFAGRNAVRGAILGAGVQARSHLPVLAALLPGLRLSVYDRHPERAEALAASAAGCEGVASAEAVASPAEAVADSDVVVTVAALGSAQLMPPEWLPDRALVVAVDFATYVSAELAASAARFVVDDRDQFRVYRDRGYFDGYPEPTATIGEALDADGSGSTGRNDREEAPVVVTHLGVGLADVLFADAVLETAKARGAGTLLPR